MANKRGGERSKERCCRLATWRNKASEEAVRQLKDKPRRSAHSIKAADSAGGIWLGRWLMCNNEWDSVVVLLSISTH